LVYNLRIKMTYNPSFRDSSALSVGNSLPNNTGSAIAKLTPVRSDASGDMDTIDVSIENEALAIMGITAEEIVNSESGRVITSGRIKDITTTASNGDIMYISKTGSLTNVKPSLGVGGFVSDDFVIFTGTVTKNQEDPLKKDLIVNITIIGQL